MAAWGGGGSSVSARALARSVAHRLKYYIEVQRKEKSFDSSGLIRDEMERSGHYTCPMCLIELQQGQPLEHDFAEIKLEAFLRAYLGGPKECYQKVQASPEKQKALEKFIKEMAKDYVPDQTNEVRAKKTQRQSYWLRTPSSLHRTATPSMSAEEVRRLVSSASKLIVAATSEISPKVLGTTREVVSTPKRRATKTIPSLDCARKLSLSSTQSHKDEAESSMPECHEELKTELTQKASESSERNGGKKPKSTKKRKNVKQREKPMEMSSDVSHNFYKSNKGLSTALPKSNDSCSLSVSFSSPYSPPGRNKVFKKGILKNRSPLSGTSSEVSEYQNVEPDSRWKGSLSPPAGHSGKLAEMKKSSCTPVLKRKNSRSIKHLARQSVLTSKKTPEAIRNNLEVSSAKEMAEAMHAQSSDISEKEVSGSAGLSEPGKEMCDQDNWKSEFSRKPQRDRSEETKGSLNSDSEKSSEGHRVHFQTLRQGYHPKNVEQKQNSDSCNLDNLRQPKNTASVDESRVLACIEKDQDKDHVLTVAGEPSLGHQVSQGEDQDAGASLAMNESMNRDGTVGNQDVKGHSGNLLKQILSLNEGDASVVDDPPSHMQINDLIFGDPWGEQVVYIPPRLPSVGQTPEEGDGSSASSGTSTPVLGRLGDRDSTEEFTISSASSHWSGKSSASTESRNTNAALKEGEENTDSSAEVHVLNAVQENSTVRPGTFNRHEERLSSGEEKGTNKDCRPESTSAAQVVYFSHLPMS